MLAPVQPQDSGLKFLQSFQVQKDDKVVIYISTFPSLEIFKPQVHKPDAYHDDVYEVYPGNEAFGVSAWCATSKAQFRDIMNRHFADHPNKSEICRGVEATMNDRGLR